MLQILRVNKNSRKKCLCWYNIHVQMHWNLHKAHFDGVGSLMEVSFTVLLHHYFWNLITGRLMEIPPSPFTSLPPPTPLALTPPPNRGGWSVLNLKKFLGIKTVSKNQQTVNSLTRSWVSEHIKCSNRPKYCKLIRPSPFFSPFTVVRPTQIFSIFKRKKKVTM